MKFSFQRTARRAVVVPFVTGLLVGGVAVTGASAALKGSAVFPDVPSGSYYDAAVGELNAAGIIKGSNGRFRPADAVSRADVAVMLYRLRAELRGESIDEGTSNGGTVSSAPSNAEASSRSRRTSSSSKTSSSSSSSSSSSAGYNPKGSFRFTTTNFSVSEQLSKVVVSVVRTGGNEGSAAIDYVVTGGSAAIGTDFTAASGTLILSNKETSKTFDVFIIDDTSSEGDETFTVTLKNPQYGVGLASPSVATVTIKDNELVSSNASSVSSNGSSRSSSSAGPAAGTFNFAATAFSMKENGASLTVTVNRVGGSSGTANVNYATENGSATSGTDYNGTSGTLSFGAGETTKTFSIAALDNSSVTGNRTFNISLATPTNGSVLGDDKKVAVTIYDDESGEFGSGALKFNKSAYEVTQSAGKVVITVQRTGGANGTINVSYATSNGTAYSGADYTTTEGVLTFQPGEAAKTFTVPVLNNSSLGGERTVNLTLHSPSSTATLVSPYSATLTIYK